MADLSEQVKIQSDLVRELKSKKADKKMIDAAVAKLLELKQKFAEEEASKNSDKDDARAFRAGFEDLMLRKFFYVPAFEIYGGIAGLFDFGPPGCAVKANFTQLWRQHFILEEHMLEVSCSALTPDVVLRTSGHVEKFTDFMVKDEKTGECHRADKLLEDHVDRVIEEGKVSEAEKKELLAAKSNADAYSQEELGEALTRFGVKAPTTGNDLCAPYPYNLMFQTSIGPTGKAIGYLRPETAQGIFVNFRRLLEYNGGRMPFAAAQLGLGFRNEISPRSGLLRCREFPMAEIEHFFNPEESTHPKFKNVRDYKLNLLGRADQTGEDIPRMMTAGEAVDKGVINHETLAYFLVRTHMFLVKTGVIEEKIRFRQHKDTEMAHYASDCWDAEILLSYGWVEVAGHANRAAFDLSVHTAKSKTDLTAQEIFDPPRLEEVAVVKPEKAAIGKAYRQTSKPLLAHLAELNKPEALALKAQLETGSATIKLCSGEEYTLDNSMVAVELETQKISVKKYLPGVIEPSFGIGRIIYAILEHSYTVVEKNGEKQGMLRLAPVIAPVKVSILPLGNDPAMFEIVDRLEAALVDLSLTSKTDPSGASIGRKYARSDEIGIPFGITIDFDSITSSEVTIRDRDSTQQIRVKLAQAPMIIYDLVKSNTTWEQAYETYPKQLR